MPAPPLRLPEQSNSGHTHWQGIRDTERAALQPKPQGRTGTATLEHDRIGGDIAREARQRLTAAKPEAVQAVMGEKQGQHHQAEHQEPEQTGAVAGGLVGDQQQQTGDREPEQAEATGKDVEIAQAQGDVSGGH